MTYPGDANVVAWLSAHEGHLVVDSIVLGELRVGVLVLPAGRKRTRLERWLTAIGRQWAELVARLRKKGTTLPLLDSVIAATALQHDLVVATRNVRDFRKAGVKVLDPFEAAS